MTLFCSTPPHDPKPMIVALTLQIVRDWVLRFNEAGPEGLITRKVLGETSILNDELRPRLVKMVEAGSIPFRGINHPQNRLIRLQNTQSRDKVRRENTLGRFVGLHAIFRMPSFQTLISYMEEKIRQASLSCVVRWLPGGSIGANNNNNLCPKL